jgi:hypothetical protein
MTRAMVTFTSSLSNSRPWWNLTPWRSLKVQVFWSSLADQLSARSGTIWPEREISVRPE